MNKKLFLITLFSLVIRLIFLNHQPLLWDEASLGYNAFSILKTGRDEYGKLFPLIFKSFGDFKPGLYVYLCLPFISLFGLSTVSVRLPSVILGSLTPFFLYQLITVFNPKKTKLALISAILLAVTPFHIHFSRGAWETNIFTFQLVLSCLFFIKFIKTNNLKSLIFSSIIFGSSLYTYQSAKMMSLLIIILLFTQNFKIILKNPKKIFIGFIIPLAIFALPITIRLFTNSDSNRLKVLSIFSYTRSLDEKDQLISYSSPLAYKLFDNDFIYFLRLIFTKYTNHLSPDFLFFKGDWQGPRHSAIYTGVLLLPSLLFLPIGILTLKTKSKLDIFMLVWLLVAPIPAALTRDTLSAVRTASLVIPLTYFVSRAIVYFSKKLKAFHFFYPAILTFVCFLSFIYYGDLYLNHTVQTNPSDYLYGYKQAIDYINKNKQNYQKVYLTDFYGQAYIYYLFYSRYPPQKFQQQASLELNSIDVGKINHIDNMFFEIIPPDSAYQDDSLIIFSKDEIWRQQLDKTSDFDQKFIPLGIINNQAQFYAYP